MEIIELAEKLKKQQDTAKGLKESLKALAGQIEETQQQLVEAMTQEEMPNFKHQGYIYCLMTKTFASPIAEKKTDLFQVLKLKGFGDLVYETVNANSFSAFAKEQIEQNDDNIPEWLTDYINIFEKTTVQMRKSK